jgi:hypothetical protein
VYGAENHRLFDRGSAVFGQFKRFREILRLVDGQRWIRTDGSFSLQESSISGRKSLDLSKFPVPEKVKRSSRNNQRIGVLSMARLSQAVSPVSLGRRLTLLMAAFLSEASTISGTMLEAFILAVAFSERPSI